jgi:AcrR family transcriptional regulator
MARTDETGTAPRRVNWEARRQVIIDTSAPVFARHGYHATGIMELCAANDLGKGALYHYIGSKEELLAAIHDRVMDEVMVGADRAATAGGSPTRQLELLGEELLDRTSNGSKRYSRPAWTRASSGPWSPGSPPWPGSGCTTIRTCG